MAKKIKLYIFIIFIFAVNIVIDFNIGNYFYVLEKCFNKSNLLNPKVYTIICFIIALISFFIIADILLVIKYRKIENKGIKFKTEDGTHGTASWMTKNEMESVLSFEKPGIILGKYDNKTLKLPFESFFNKNICVFGSSGSMKTIGFVLTNLLELSLYKKSIICTDPKGEIYRKTSIYFKNLGYTVKVLNLKDMKHSDRWNPLGENETITDVQTSSDVIISNTQRHDKGGDEFWPRAEENLLKAFEFYFLQGISDKNNLTEVYKYVAGGDIGEISEKFGRLESDSPARMSYNIFASGSDTIKASVITGLGTRLQMFQNEDLQRLTSETDIDLCLPGKEPCIYYIITSDMDSSFDFIASLFYTFLFIKLVRYADSRPDGKCENEVYFFLDEFANLGQIPDFNKKISTVRSRGIGLIPILQNKPQLDSRYPNGISDEIVGNCDTRISMGITDVPTAEFFCDLIGVATVETTSIRKENSLEGDIGDLGQKNVSTIERNLINKDEILRLPVNKLIVNLRGNKPVLLDKVIYTDHPACKKLKDSPISEYNPEWAKIVPQNTAKEEIIEPDLPEPKKNFYNY